MKILSYRELECKDGLLPLMDQAFGWAFNPRAFERSIRLDPRLKNSEVGFCAIEEGRVIGYVGVLDLVTRTLDGSIEHVGGLYGVATLPSYAHRGICTALLNHVHTFFSEKHYRFSFLNTSPILVAYALYKKLGYKDVVEHVTVYRLLKGRKGRGRLKQAKTVRPDLGNLLRLYSEYVKGKNGFVIRDEAYMKMLKREWLATSRCVISDKGYVLFKKERNLIRVRELVASDAKEMHRLVGLVEEDARDIVLARLICDPALLEVFKSRGYTIPGKTYGVMMAKPLAEDASFGQVYGDRFYMSILDHF